jgi:hypothetical protein
MKYVAIVDGKRRYVKPGRNGEPLAFAVFVTRANGRIEIVERVEDGHRPMRVWTGGRYEAEHRLLDAAARAEEKAGWWRRHALKENRVGLGVREPGAVVAVHVAALSPVLSTTKLNAREKR